MITLKNKLLIYEFDCLHSILSIDNEILTKLFNNIIIPQIVYDKFKNKLDKNMQSTVKELSDKKVIIFEDFEVESEQFILYKKLIKGIQCKSMGRLESAAISIAKYNNLTILSNKNNDYLTEFDIKHVLIDDFIVNKYVEESISLDEAELLWKSISINFRLLNGTFDKYLVMKET